MKTYYLKWYDKNEEKLTTILINDSQKKLIDFMREHFPIDDMLYNESINITIDRDEEPFYNLAVD